MPSDPTLERFSVTPILHARPLSRGITTGALASRAVAYLCDVLLIGLLVVAGSVVVLLLGLVTFGAGWLLFGILVPLIALAYHALTVGSSRQATPGMRLFGLRVIKSTGGSVDVLTAAVHALLFYISAGTFILFVVDVLFGFLRDDRRLGRDVLTGVAVIRA